MPAPKGNQNAKTKPWASALKRALARNGGSVDAGLNKIANQVVDAAIKGDQWAVNEIGNRVDGKPAQQQIIDGTLAVTGGLVLNIGDGQ